MDIGVALGMAYKLNGVDSTQTDFRREECAYTRKFDQVKSPLIVLSFLLFLVIALGVIDAIYQVKKVKAEYQLMLENAQTQLAELMEDNAAAEAVWRNQEFGARRMQAISSEVERLHDDLARQLGRSQSIPVQPSALSAWIEFSNLLRENEEDLGRLWLDRIDISTADRSAQLKITGIMESNQKYNRLLDLLQEDPLYGEARLGKTSFTEDGRLEFTETVVDLDLDELLSRKEG